LAGLEEEQPKKKKVKLGIFGGQEDEGEEDDGDGLSTGSKKSFMSKIGPGGGRRKKRAKRKEKKEEVVGQLVSAVDLGTNGVIFGGEN
jgi:hypothetical protein